MFENVVESKRQIESPPNIDIIRKIDFENLKDYVKVWKLDKEINRLKREIDDLRTPKIFPKTLAEIKREVEDIYYQYLVREETNLTEMIRRRQLGENIPHLIRPDEILEQIQKLVSLKNLAKQIYLITTVKTGIEGYDESHRESEIKMHQKEISKLENEKGIYFPKGQAGWFTETGREIDRWRSLVVYFGNPIDINGRYLNPAAEDDKQWLEAYIGLELEEVPRHKLFRPLAIDGKEYIYHPGYGFPGL